MFRVATDTEDSEGAMRQHNRQQTRLCRDFRPLCYMCCYKAPPTDRAKAKNENIRVITVEFNAWEYSGCDYLWAGIVTTLGSKVEEYFGKWKVRLCRLLETSDKHQPEQVTSLSLKCCYMNCKIYMLLLCLTSILVLSITVIVLLSLGDDEITPARAFVALSSLATTAVAILAGTSPAL